ncbi:hypothetical protein JW872_01485 [Candidatus Babeliales bacterium]|nr:hypothetical protein [Candidatus Babeliales bacterium]
MTYRYLLALIALGCSSEGVHVTIVNDFGAQVLISTLGGKNASNATIALEAESSHKVGDMQPSQTIVIYIHQGLAVKKAYLLSLSSVESPNPQESTLNKPQIILNVNSIVTAADTDGLIVIQDTSFTFTFAIANIPVPKESKEAQVSQKTRYDMLFTM